MDFTTGDRVGYRGLSWDVISVELDGPQTWLRLRCAQGDLAGLEWDALHPWDALEPRDLRFRPAEPGSVQDWWLYHVAQWRDAPPPTQPLVAFGPGRLTPEPWQLVPLLRALDMPRPRLLLADGVGLGKTVQACLIASELIQRRRAHRIIIVTPAGPLLTQWSDELRSRFGLRPVVLADSTALRAEQRRMELGGNPFDAASLCLTSLDFAKQDAVLGELERSSWDLAIIDEAHHCFGDTGMTTHRRKLAEVLARRADGLLLLTATPHDGQDAHFASLIALLDPVLVDGAGRLIGQDYRRHVIRRLKSHIRDRTTGAALFRHRIIMPLPVSLTGSASRFHQALTALMAPRLRKSSGGSMPTDMLAFIGLLKRAASSIAAAIRTLTVVADRYESITAAGTTSQRARQRRLRALRDRTLRYGTLSPAEERAQAELEAEDIAERLHTATDANPEDALRAIIHLGNAARAEDPKLRALISAIRTIRVAEPEANILVYTEYADSQDAARDALRDDIAIGTVLTISGADDDDSRSRAADRFATEDGLVLVSTDSLAEGLNLQRRCHHLIHLDLPYNPNRLEQRNGRIDRYGQVHDPEIRYLYLAGTFEERLLLRLIAKYERARAELEVMPNTLGVTADDGALAASLVQGFAEEQAPLFPAPPSAIRTLDQDGESHHAYRALHREIGRAFGGFEGIAMQHGWWDGGGAALTTTMPVAQALPDTSSGGITTPSAFLACAVAAAGGSAEPGLGDTNINLTLPSGWTVDLSGLPGFEPDQRRLCITANPDRLRDAAGRALACPGWGHPVVLHALDRLRATPDVGNDPRIAVAIGPDPVPEVVLTYAVDILPATPGSFRHLVAVRLRESGKPSLEADISHWLRADHLDARHPERAWDRHFAHWLPSRLDSVRRSATKAAQAAMEGAVRHHAARIAHETARLERWVTRRATELCGPPAPQIGDLFAPLPASQPPGPGADPLSRLDAVIRDPKTTAAIREEAEAVRMTARERRHHLLPPGPSTPALPVPVGMLLLLPHA